MVFVSCFGVRVSVMFHFMFVHYTFSFLVQFGLLSDHLFGNTCPQFVLNVFCQFVIFICFPFWF